MRNYRYTEESAVLHTCLGRKVRGVVSCKRVEKGRRHGRWQNGVHSLYSIIMYHKIILRYYTIIN